MSAEYRLRSGKRPGSPIEASNSFVKNVATRVSSFLPNTFKRWFGSPSSSNANGSAAVAESSASSSEDEDPPAQPPTKRARFTSVSTVTNHVLPETKCAGTSTDFTEPISVVQSSSMSIFKPESNFASTPLRSGGTETNFERDKDSPIYSQSSYVYEASKSVAKKRKSLFDTRNTEEVCKISRKSSPVLDYSQPKYKPSLLGSPFNTRYTNASTYLNRPNIKQKIDVVVSEPPRNDNVTLSHSTRRILDLLENYSSPLIEAKRISQCQRCVPDTLNKNSHENKASANVSNYQELYVPKYAKSLQLKRLRSKLNDSTSAARQIYASLSSSQPFEVYPTSKGLSDTTTEKSDKLTTKMKTNLTRINRNKVQSDMYRPEPVNLPTAVLQIDPNNLPKFKLGTSETETSKTTPTITSSETTANASTGSAADIITTESNSANQLTEQELISVDKTDSIDSQIVYTFSSPVYVNAGIVKISQIINYPFDSPERQLVKQSKDSSQSEIWKCKDCSVSEIDSNKCVCCGIKKSSNNDVNMKKCSVCKAVLSQENLDKCLDCTKKIDKSEERGPQTNQPSKWKCQDCWVSNDESVDKCVCCGGKKPQTVTAIANSKSNNVDSEWKCDICWIKNKKSAETCLACGGAKPVATESKTKANSSPPTTGNIPTSTQAFKKIVVEQSDKWECHYCLVRNNKNRSTCVCCDAEKPGAVRESEYKKFNFGQVPNTFKFTIDHNQNKSNNNSGSVPVALSESTLKELDANNDNVPKPATFTFGIPKQQTNATISEEETIIKETPKPTFTFGLSKPVAAPAMTKSTVDSLETDETVQEVPNVVGPNTSVSDNTTRPVGLFGIPLNTPATTAPAPITFGHTEKVTTALPVPAVTTTAVDAKTSQSIFNFSASGIKPGLFSAVVPTPATTSISFPTVQTPATSTVPFFQKSEPVQTSSMQFFSKTDPVPSTSTLFNKNYTPATTEAPAPVSNVPVFSFGSTNPNPIQAEKPKFNFTFSKKTETSPSFTLQVPNNGSILSGNNLPSGSSLAAPNPIGSNNMPIALGLGFPSNDSSSIRMTAGNTIEQEQGINNMPAVPSSNPFSVQATKENTWWPNQNPSNTTSTANPANNSVGAAQNPMFGAQEKSENNMWSLNTNNNNSNMFVQNTAANGVQKPAAFSFASQDTSSMPFNSNNMTPSTNFGSPAQMSPVFGMARQDNNQPALFSSNLQTLQTTQNNMFGAQASNNTAPSLGMFGAPNASSTLFGSPPSSVPTFEAAPSIPNVPAPTFNFGAQRTTGVFGFGQQQAPSQPGVYNFGAGAAGPPQRQFNIGTAGGSASAIGQRRIKRAVRRNTPR